MVDAPTRPAEDERAVEREADRDRDGVDRELRVAPENQERVGDRLPEYVPSQVGVTRGGHEVEHERQIDKRREVDLRGHLHHGRG